MTELDEPAESLRKCWLSLNVSSSNIGELKIVCLFSNLIKSDWREEFAVVLDGEVAQVDGAKRVEERQFSLAHPNLKKIEFNETACFAKYKFYGSLKTDLGFTAVIGQVW